MILIRALSITRATGRGGPWNRAFFGPWNGKSKASAKWAQKSRDFWSTFPMAWVIDLPASKSLSQSAIYGIYGSYWQCFASELKPDSPGSADPDPDQESPKRVTSMLKELYGALKASPLVLFWSPSSRCMAKYIPVSLDFFVPTFKFSKQKILDLYADKHNLNPDAISEKSQNPDPIPMIRNDTPPDPNSVNPDTKYRVLGN